MLNPVPVQGAVPIVVGLAAAAANWGVARLLLEPSRKNAAIRLAYLHNLGDVWVSLAPVTAGALLLLTGYSFFDPLIAGAVALWIIVTTTREVFESHDELIWPDKIVCCHSNHNEIGIAASATIELRHYPELQVAALPLVIAVKRQFDRLREKI
jgi:cobalt-zinc-cadmium efflux system protein